MRKIVALLLLLFTTACTNQAAFLSTPAGARVFVDGNAVGVTPCSFEYRNGTGGTYEVVLEKEGYDSVAQTVTADEVNRGARNKWLAAGVVWSPLWLGTLFTRKLNDTYEFVLKRQPAVVQAQAQVPERPL